MSRTHIRVTAMNDGRPMLLPVGHLTVSVTETHDGCTLWHVASGQAWSVRESFEEIAAMLGCGAEPPIDVEATRAEIAQLRKEAAGFGESVAKNFNATLYQAECDYLAEADRLDSTLPPEPEDDGWIHSFGEELPEEGARIWVQHYPGVVFTFSGEIVGDPDNVLMVGPQGSEVVMGDAALWRPAPEDA